MFSSVARLALFSFCGCGAVSRRPAAVHHPCPPVRVTPRLRDIQHFFRGGKQRDPACDGFVLE